VHSLSHALGAMKSPSLHHGTLNAVLLPAVLRFNEGAAPEKFASIRRTLGLSPGQDVARFIESLNDSLGLPKGLAEMGVPHEAIDDLAKAAVLDHSTATNPRPATEADFTTLLQEAW
jgi:4-hydroxybutyrate dehydrogenase